MENKKLFWGIRPLICIAMVAVISFTMTGCDNGSNSNSHTHDFSGAWHKDDDQHWKECPTDGEKAQIANHDHQFTSTAAPTHEADGFELYTCVCGGTEQQGPFVPAYRYVITGSGTEFNVTRGITSTEAVGTADDTIFNVITAIRTDAEGKDCTIQFGDNGETLDTGEAYANFEGTDQWGLITLTGKITSISSAGTINIRNNVSIVSNADIANNTSAERYAILHNSTGALTISGGTVESTENYNTAVRNSSTGAVNITGGTVSAPKGNAVDNNSTGAVNISGGTLSAYRITVNNYSTGSVSISGGTVSASVESVGIPVRNYSTGTINISGGTVSVTVGEAVYNYSTGKITVSGTALITSRASSGTIYLNNSGALTEDRLVITGGTVENTSTSTNTGAIFNDSPGAVTISGGTVSATNGNAVRSDNIGKITVSGTALITSANNDNYYGTIYLNNHSSLSTGERLVITGGTVENTAATAGNAIYNRSTGAVTITGGTISKAGTGNFAILNFSSGVVTVGEGVTKVGNVSNTSSGSITGW